MNRWPLWRLQRAWATGVAPRLCLVLGTCVSLCALAAAGWRHQEQRAEMRLLSIARSQQSHLQLPQAVTRPDFVADLPVRTDGVEALKDVEEAAALAGVQLTAVKVDGRDGSKDELGQMTIAIEMRGTYGAAKDALHQLLMQLPNATLSSLRIRRASSDGQIDAAVQLTVWSAPLIAIGR